MKNRILLIYLLNLFIFSIEKYLIFPFNQIIKNESSFYENLYRTEYVSNILVGTPPQNIPLYLKFSQYYFYICNDINYRVYNRNLSKSFFTKNENETFYPSVDFSTCIFAYETLYLQFNNKIKIIKDFPFIFAGKKKYDIIYPSSIGLGNKGFESYNFYNFIDFLYKNKEIESKIFFIHFINETYGNLIIGNKFEEYDNKKYKNYKFERTYTFLETLNFDWVIGCDTKVNNFLLEKEVEVMINMNVEYYIFSENLKNYLNSIFFSKFFNQSICFIEEFANIYFLYYCDLSFENEIINFPNISFYQKELNHTFHINKNNLFRKFNNKIYFNAIFEKYGRKKTVLGKPLFLEYQIIFDLDKKMIGFYFKNDIIKNNTIQRILIIIFLFIIIIIFLLYLFYFRKYYYRKHRKNELIENFDYIPQN